MIIQYKHLLCFSLQLRFFCPESATGKECECWVHEVKLLGVRRSGEFGEAEAQLKEWKLASSLGAERFLLALCSLLRCSQSYIMDILERKKSYNRTLLSLMQLY